MATPKKQPDEPNDTRPDEAGASTGYVLGRLAAAFNAGHEHADLGARQRAGVKAQDWAKVLRGMMSGALRIGSRTPVVDAPAWATPKVVQGGFATGDLLAGGALEPHEQELLDRLPAVQGAAPRAVLNAHYLGDAGLAEMQKMVKTGRYRIDVPEEGALPVIAWMLGQGHVEAARALLAEIGPHLGRLRFYPAPNARPLSDTSLVHLRTVGQTAQGLGALRVPPRLQAQREAALVWAPLGDRAARLFLETYTDGWPCRHYPDGWRERARLLLDDYRRLKDEKRPLCRKHERKGENSALLRGFLETCVSDPARLTGRDVGLIRRVLADITAKRGLPGSDRCLALRQSQAAQARKPAVAELAQVVIGRMAGLPPDEGLDDLDGVLAPVTPGAMPLAGRLAEKVRRCRSAPVEVLVEENVITSAEALATVVPQITALVRAAGIDDPDLRRLYGSVYRAFRRRRSLLLLNLESQVKFHELPWVRAVEVHRGGDPSAAGTARQTLERVVVLAVTSFPHQILPNKLLQEIRALAADAGLALPLVDEVAADIFMGAFTEKFLRAAQAAAALLEGTLYERYYGLPYARVRQIDDVRPARAGGAPTSPAFFRLCSELAGPGAGGGSPVARNGTIIEQEQILTTHNLAALLGALGLADALRPRLGELARQNFAWVCRRQRQAAPAWKSRLQVVKNAAYAWRQMVFFLALMPRPEVEEFLAWASEHLDAERPALGARFRPALEGLARAARGLPTEDPARPELARRFLGWTTGTHWLLRQEAEPPPS